MQLISLVRSIFFHACSYIRSIYAFCVCKTWMYISIGNVHDTNSNFVVTNVVYIQRGWAVCDYC